MKKKSDFKVEGETYPLKDYYAVLGISRQDRQLETISSVEIKTAYRQKTLEHHPDKNLGNEEEAAEKFKQVVLAYQILSKPEAKRVLDQELQANLDIQKQVWVSFIDENQNPQRVNLAPILFACEDEFLSLSRKLTEAPALLRAILQNGKDLNLSDKFWLALILATIEKYHTIENQQPLLTLALEAYQQKKIELRSVQYVLLSYPDATKYLLANHLDFFSGLHISQLITLMATFPSTFDVIMHLHGKTLTLSNLCQMKNQLKGKNKLTEAEAERQWTAMATANPILAPRWDTLLHLAEVLEKTNKTIPGNESDPKYILIAKSIGKLGASALVVLKLLDTTANSALQKNLFKLITTLENPFLETTSADEKENFIRCAWSIFTDRKIQDKNYLTKVLQWLNQFTDPSLILLYLADLDLERFDDAAFKQACLAELLRIDSPFYNLIFHLLGEHDSEAADLLARNPSLVKALLEIRQFQELLQALRPDQPEDLNLVRAMISNTRDEQRSTLISHIPPTCLPSSDDVVHAYQLIPSRYPAEHEAQIHLLSRLCELPSKSFSSYGILLLGQRLSALPLAERVQCLRHVSPNELKEFSTLLHQIPDWQTRFLIVQALSAAHSEWLQGPEANIIFTLLIPCKINMRNLAAGESGLDLGTDRNDLTSIYPLLIFVSALDDRSSYGSMEKLIGLAVKKEPLITEYKQFLYQPDVRKILASAAKSVDNKDDQKNSEDKAAKKATSKLIIIPKKWQKATSIEQLQAFIWHHQKTISSSDLHAMAEKFPALVSWLETQPTLFKSFLAISIIEKLKKQVGDAELTVKVEKNSNDLFTSELNSYVDQIFKQLMDHSWPPEKPSQAVYYDLFSAAQQLEDTPPKLEILLRSYQSFLPQTPDQWLLALYILDEPTTLQYFKSLLSENSKPNDQIAQWCGDLADRVIDIRHICQQGLQRGLLNFEKIEKKFGTLGRTALQLTDNECTTPEDCAYFEQVLRLGWITGVQFQTPAIREFLLHPAVRRYLDYYINKIAGKQHTVLPFNFDNQKMPTSPGKFILEYTRILKPNSPSSPALEEVYNHLALTIEWKNKPQGKNARAWRQFLHNVLDRHQAQINQQFSTLVALRPSVQDNAVQHAHNPWLHALNSALIHPLNNPALLATSETIKQQRRIKAIYLLGAVLLLGLAGYLLSIPLTAGASLPVLYAVMPALCQIIVPYVAMALSLIGVFFCLMSVRKASLYQPQQRAYDAYILPVIQNSFDAKNYPLLPIEYGTAPASTLFSPQRVSGSSNDHLPTPDGAVNRSTGTGNSSESSEAGNSEVLQPAPLLPSLEMPD